MKNIIPGKTEHPFEVLKRCGGYYECPKSPEGKRLGPLVGYAGKYGPKGEERQYVGDIYANFAKAECHGPVLDWICKRLGWTISSTLSSITGFIGLPEGGKALATALAIDLGRQYVYPDRKVTALKTETAREKSDLVFERHELHEGERWIIVEDVCNNFSTTAKSIELVESFGAKVIAIACFLNRSLEVNSVYSPRANISLPVISLVRQPILEYQQDYPAVAEDIEKGNVVLKPKNEWSRLMNAMERK